MGITDEDIHPYLQARMLQPGVSKEEIEVVLNKGREAKDAKPGTYGKVFLFQYGREWEGQFYKEREVTVYYKLRQGRLILLTVKARYGSFKGDKP